VSPSEEHEESGGRWRLRERRRVARIACAVLITVLTAATEAVPGVAAAATVTVSASVGVRASVSAPHARGEIALRFALAQRGKPYVYGGTGPSSYDCSGLVQRAWRVAGVRIPRTTQEQARTGAAVPLGKVRLGDLVIFYHDASHVGIYAGHGMVVVAPHAGAVVRLQEMRWMPIYAVRRPR